LSKRIALFVWILIFAGCAAQTQRSTRPCAGKKTAAEAVETLNSRRQQTKPIRAAGLCLLQYRLEGKQHKENFPVKLWVNPPNDIFLQGDVAFDAAGLVLGSNADEFWFWLKPKEISTCWWGKWSQAGQWQSFAISPAVLLEALGSVGVPGDDWSLTHGRLDVLWLHNDQGDLLKRIFIETCDYVVTKIEYFDSTGKIAATAEFSAHRMLAEGFFVPTRIRIINSADGKNENSAEISLASIGITRLNEQQRQRLFVRPKPRGFDHIYRIVDGSAVEQMNE
jgi:hypothetical protein